MIGTERSAIGWAMNTGVADTLYRSVSRRGVMDAIGAGFLAAVILAIALYAWLRPAYNWDMVAYIATALEDRIADPVELHRQTWAEIEKGASESQLYHLKFSNPYNLNQWENPVDFQSQLSMYRVKEGYIGALRLLEPVTGLARGSILLSILPAIAFGALALWWLARENALQAGLIVAPFLTLADFGHMTTAVTPDMLLSAVSLAAVLLLARGKDVAACLLLFLSVFIRPDNIILIFALLIAAVLFGWRIMPMLITFVGSFAACIFISKMGGHPGWWAHFYFSCVKIQNSMANFHPDFSLVDFARGYVRGVVVALMDNDWPGLLVLLVAAWALLWRYGKVAVGRENALIFALAIGTLGKFASFPLPDDRFYFEFLAVMAVLLAGIWKPRFDGVRMSAKTTA